MEGDCKGKEVGRLEGLKVGRSQGLKVERSEGRKVGRAEEGGKQGVRAAGVGLSGNQSWHGGFWAERRSLLGRDADVDQGESASLIFTLFNLKAADGFD